jgi:fluoroquinolone resistance protein
MNFDRDSYYQEKLVKLSLTGESAKLIEFEDCEFNGCSLIDCKFHKCKFINCKFVDCILSAINAVDSSFIGITFSKCKVIGFDWTKVARFQDLEFRDSIINYSNFKMLKCREIKMENCEIKEADLTEADLTDSVLAGTDFENTIFFKTNLTRADLRGARNYSIDIRNNILKKAMFSIPEALSLLGSLDIIIE